MINVNKSHNFFYFFSIFKRRDFRVEIKKNHKIRNSHKSQIYFITFKNKLLKFFYYSKGNWLFVNEKLQKWLIVNYWIYFHYLALVWLSILEHSFSKNFETNILWLTKFLLILVLPLVSLGEGSLIIWNLDRWRCMSVMLAILFFCFNFYSIFGSKYFWCSWRIKLWIYLPAIFECWCASSIKTVPIEFCDLIIMNFVSVCILAPSYFSNFILLDLRHEHLI